MVSLIATSMCFAPISATVRTLLMATLIAKKLLGVDVRTIKGRHRQGVWPGILRRHQKEGEITEVSYMFVRPGPDKTPVPKVSFVTRVGDLGCGVGYYK